MALFSLAPGAESAEPAAKAGKRKWAMLFVLSLALCVIILDTTILNVAISSIIRDLHATIQGIQWVITAYSLTLAALTITGGRLGDLFGKKRMFMLGAILFASGSFIASMATSVPMLIIGEAIVEGIGAALMMPATASLLVEHFEGRERAIAFGIWGGVAGAAAALGPIIGGFLATNYSWRWGLRINVAVVAALLVGSVLIPKTKVSANEYGFDIGGVLLSAAGLLSLVFGFVEASRYGWWMAKEVFIIGGRAVALPLGLSIVPACIAIGIAVLGLFLLWVLHREATGRTALVSTRIFSSRQFASGIFTMLVLSLGQTGLFFALPVFLQAVRGYDALHTGLALLPMSVSLLLVAPLSAIIGRKISPKAIIVAGLSINAVSYFVLRGLLSVAATGDTLIPGLILFGIGMGLVMSQINNLTMSAVRPQEAGEASGLNNTMRHLGSTLGSAIMGTILIGALSANFAAGVASSSVIPEKLKPRITAALRDNASEAEFRGGAAVATGVPPAIGEELTRIVRESIVAANKRSLGVGAMFALGGVIAGLFLPGKKRRAAQAVAPADASNPVIAPPSPGRLTTDHVAALIRADQTSPRGIAFEVQHLIDAIAVGIAFPRDERLAQARALWDRGWGRALGFADFAAYARSVPSAPSETVPAGRRLLLVDHRLSAADACRTIGMAVKGGAEALSSHRAKGEAYWIIADDGRLRDGVAASGFSADGALGGLTVAEGIALAVQDPVAIRDRYVDLIDAPHDGFSGSVGCIGVWRGAPGLRWRWNDDADPRCGAAARFTPRPGERRAAALQSAFARASAGAAA